MNTINTQELRTRATFNLKWRTGNRTGISDLYSKLHCNFYPIRSRGCRPVTEYIHARTPALQLANTLIYFFRNTIWTLQYNRKYTNRGHFIQLINRTWSHMNWLRVNTKLTVWKTRLLMLRLTPYNKGFRFDPFWKAKTIDESLLWAKNKQGQNFMKRFLFTNLNVIFFLIFWLNSQNLTVIQFVVKLQEFYIIRQFIDVITKHRHQPV
jgi:hypothetical protein